MSESESGRTGLILSTLYGLSLVWPGSRAVSWRDLLTALRFAPTPAEMDVVLSCGWVEAISGHGGAGGFRVLLDPSDLRDMFEQ